MNYEPTEAEVYDLLNLLQREAYYTGLTHSAARFILRHYELRHYEPHTREQRCDGSRTFNVYAGNGEIGEAVCPGCVNCATPTRADYGKSVPSETSTATAHAAAPVAPVTVALDDRSLRAIYSVVDALLELQYSPALRTCRPATRDDFPGFAEIDKAKEGSK